MIRQLSVDVDHAPRFAVKLLWRLSGSVVLETLLAVRCDRKPRSARVAWPHLVRGRWCSSEKATSGFNSAGLSKQAKGEIDRFFKEMNEHSGSQPASGERVTLVEGAYRP